MIDPSEEGHEQPYPCSGNPAGSNPIGEILLWAAFAGILALLVIYFVGAEQGATSLISAIICMNFARWPTLMAFPCH